MEVHEILTNLKMCILPAFYIENKHADMPKSDLPELLEMSDTQVSLCHCSRLNGIGFQSALDRVSQLVGWFEAGSP